MEKDNQKTIGIAVIVLLAVFAGYLLFANQSATARINALNASSTALSSQVTSLTAEDLDLAANLLLVSAPLGLTSPTTPMLVSTKGILSMESEKDTFVITTPYGIRASVKNSSASGVAAIMKPLLGETVQISGTFIPGTPNITVTNVNGSPVR